MLCSSCWGWLACCVSGLSIFLFWREREKRRDLLEEDFFCDVSFVVDAVQLHSTGHAPPFTYADVTLIFSPPTTHAIFLVDYSTRLLVAYVQYTTDRTPSLTRFYSTTSYSTDTVHNTFHWNERQAMLGTGRYR
jgi:hypothetical protein